MTRRTPPASTGRPGAIRAACALIVSVLLLPIFAFGRNTDRSWPRDPAERAAMRAVLVLLICSWAFMVYLLIQWVKS